MKVRSSLVAAIAAIAAIAAFTALTAVRAEEAQAGTQSAVEVIVVTAKRPQAVRVGAATPNSDAVEVIVVTAKRPQPSTDDHLVASARRALNAQAIEIALPEIDVRGLLADRAVTAGVVSVRL
jgi:hypothetical protein